LDTFDAKFEDSYIRITRSAESHQNLEIIRVWLDIALGECSKGLSCRTSQFYTIFHNTNALCLCRYHHNMLLSLMVEDTNNETTRDNEQSVWRAY